MPNSPTDASLQGVADRIRGRGDWVVILRSINGVHAALTGPEIAAGLRVMGEDLAQAKTARALAIARVAAFKGGARFLREARRSGVFRASKYAFRGEAVHYIVGALIRDSLALGWSNDDLGYLSSVQEL